jgi:hypothetical protein
VLTNGIWIGAGTSVGSEEGRKDNLRSQQSYLDAQDHEVSYGTPQWPARSGHRSRYLVLPQRLFWLDEEWFLVLVWFCERDKCSRRKGERDGDGLGGW